MKRAGRNIEGKNITTEFKIKKNWALVPFGAIIY
jgi:hypothetical protein